jgi:hypothetical protein
VRLPLLTLHLTGAEALRERIGQPFPITTAPLAGGLRVEIRRGRSLTFP